MSKNNATNTDWQKLIDKLEKEIVLADQSLVDICIARECQETVLAYAQEQIKKYPVIMATCKNEDCEKEAEEGKEFCEEHKEE